MARDRFVLSNGHGCALLYSMLHLSGHDLSLDDLKNFRQLGSKTPGHPENHMTPGIEVTTGPLGSGVANAAGLAMAEAHLAATYNKPDFELFNNFTYVFLGDGCMQEGVQAEAASLAGHLGLGKMIMFYDDNSISIDGDTSLSFSEDVGARYESYGFQVLRVADGDNDLAAIDAAVTQAKAETDKPTLIIIRTTIGFASSKQGKESSHGSPLGDEDLANVKTALGFNPAEKFAVPDDVRAFWADKQTQFAENEAKWNAMFEKYTATYPELAGELTRRMAGELPSEWESKLPAFESGKDATRNLSGKVLNALAPQLPELMGGSADLTPSNKTALKCTTDFSKADRAGRYIRFGVREHAMVGIANGLAAYGGFIPFTATFLNFIEFAFPAVRLAALSHFGTIMVMTHDSVALGEDGPTHQPVEAINMCRATPNVLTFRPADGNETTGAYIQAIQNRSRPSVLALTRQGLPTLPNSTAAVVAKGAYVVQDPDKADVILVGTGSEVSLCMEAAAVLASNNNLTARVVSMPCAELFDEQSVAYRRDVLTPGVPTFTVEAAAIQGWEKYGHYAIGMKSFGASGPGPAAMAHFGFTADKVSATVADVVERAAKVAAELNTTAFGLLPCQFE
jgi:transketolase